MLTDPLLERPPYPSDAEQYVLDTRFKDKDEGWLETRKWIHSNSMDAKKHIWCSIK